MNTFVRSYDSYEIKNKDNIFVFFLCEYLKLSFRSKILCDDVM